MATIVKKNVITLTFANDYVSEGADRYGNYAIYADMYVGDDRTKTVKLSVTDDSRPESFSTRATDLARKISKTDRIQGKKLNIENPWINGSFYNVGKYGKLTWAAEPGIQAISAPAPQAKAPEGFVAVSAYTRRAPRK